MSVANLTRQDGEEYMMIAARMKIETEVQTFPLQQANETLNALRASYRSCGTLPLETAKTTGAWSMNGR